MSEASTASTRKPVVLLTGASGYVGRHIANAVSSSGADVVCLGRKRLNGTAHIDFELGAGAPSLAALGTNADCLIHCAYDFTPRTWSDIRRVNVEGTRSLFAAAKECGVRRIVLISTLSAHGAARSLYGKAKLGQEDMVRELGGVAIRPGLVWGTQSGGMVGTLEKLVEKLPVVPLIGGANRRQFLINVNDLARIVATLARSDTVLPDAAISAAHPQSRTMKEILLAIAARSNLKAPMLVPVPWRAAWLGIKSLEYVFPKINIRSDSVLGLIYADPKPDIRPSLLRELNGNSDILPFFDSPVSRALSD